ncbi:MAG: IS21 family transposase, partial [Myxococcota bacterium]
RERGTPVLDRVRGRMDELLEAWPSWTAKKQQLTAARLHAMLIGEGFEVGYSLVKDYVREWRRTRREVFVPLEYPPGDSGQVDFFEVVVDIGDERQKAWMFVLRLMHSKRDFARLYPRQDQICFLDGHVRAFEHLGAIPQRLVYDNLKAAVAKKLAGSERQLTPRFEELARHYLFEPCFARPYTGHDKGGVEARGKGIRWQHLVPIPAGPDLDSVNRALLERLDRCVDAPGFERELNQMLSLPARPFRASKAQSGAVSRRALVKVEGAQYSVWSKWAGLDVTVYIGPDYVEVEGPGNERVRHPRKRFGERSVDYRHYLAELSKKPQAVRQVAGPLTRDLGAPFDRVWRELVERHGPKQAARIFAKVLGALPDLGRAEVISRLEAAKASDTPLLIALRNTVDASVQLDAERIPATLADVQILYGSAADYDEWLGRGAL